MIKIVSCRLRDGLEELGANSAKLIDEFLENIGQDLEQVKADIDILCEYCRKQTNRNEYPVFIEFESGCDIVAKWKDGSKLDISFADGEDY